ncbi:hypothetical protein [Paenibacillus sp. Cedars]|uniref:DUF6941 family protein n=1 Tax=Paenibacillus sp. Cedars TaxID=1980674 RepID=UPI0011634D6C|nr:hypothetical protein [Paenibacillus sp. Cedars]AWP28692.1 hypothetical protein B9D94_19590 [Paenibacillus sp. Cedars]
MKIRTFLVCEDVDFNSDDSTIVIKKMMRGILTKKFPAKETVSFLLTFEDTPQKDGELIISILSNKGKPVIKYKFDLLRSQDAITADMDITFPEPGEYKLKITYGDEFLGKYRFPVIKDGDEDE